MHEFSLAKNIIDIASSELEKHGKLFVDEIKLEVGKLSGVEILPLETALKSFTIMDSFSETHFFIDEIRAIGHCNLCGQEQVLSDLFEICKQCGGASFKLIKGKEFLIKTITMH